MKHDTMLVRADTYSIVIHKKMVYHRVWFLSACAYIPTAREVGLITHRRLVLKTFGALEDGESCQQRY